MESVHHTAGSLIWVWASDEQGWLKGTVQRVEQDGQLLVSLEDGKAGKYKANDCPLRNVESRMGVEDMTALSYLNEPGVLWNLKCRYVLDAIYTYTGSILIAVNPFASLPHMYGVHMMEQYRGRTLGELSPHVYAIADAAYRQMRKDSKSQSILVSGESGAGKTETSKLIMQYLAWMGNETSGTSDQADDAGQPSVEQKVLESNPLLEAFGNAKTVRNDNSSRFGKFVEIQFSKQGRISGAAVRTYLLERSRVVQLTDPERNYHIFYQLCEGATPQERKTWALKPASEFHYLNQSSCYKLDRVDNAEEFKKTRRAMTLVGIPVDEQAAIFATVAAVLHLGNITFSEGQEESSVVSGAEGKFHLEAAARLLGTDAQGLTKALTTRTRHTVDGPIVSPLDVRAADDNKDSLAKMVYSRMFDWLVQKINTAIGQDPEALALVGVLDIYGFEQFRENDFEQFCINLANEKLQQHFNQHVFKMEQAEYEREAIDWSYIQFVDNQDVLDLIERKPMGVLDILDEQCRFPRATNMDFANKLYGTPEVAKSARFRKPKLDQSGFTIQHYAGAVTYKTENFLAKNKDFVVSEHQQLMQSSTQAFVRALFPADPEEQTADKGRGGRAVGSGYKFSSVGARFKRQLGDLMAALHTMEPHYIRCIKPNSKNQPMDFENNNALHQLRCGGVLEAVRISCAGFPTKMPYEDFVDHFWNLAPQLLARTDLDDAAIAKAIVSKANLEGFQAGKTKMFLRAGQMAELDKLRTEMMNKSAIIIQRCMRGYLARSHFTKKKAAVVTLQAGVRGMLARKRAATIRRQRAAKRIQTAWRMAHQRFRYQQSLLAVLTIQAAWRGHVARSLALDLRQLQAAVLIQSTWRGSRARASYLAYRKAVVALQSCWRRKMARRELRRRRMEAREAGKLLQDKKALDDKLKETLAVLENVQNQRNELRQSYKEEKSAREAAEALVASAQQGNDKALEELRLRLNAQLAAEVASHAATKEQLVALQKQVSNLSVAAEAARAQLQAHSISSQQRTAQFERQKAGLEAAAAAVKSDLMNRLNNAIKQRDAAREEALLATQKLNQFQEELDSGALTPTPSPAPSSLHDPGMIDRAQRFLPNASPSPGHAAPDSNGIPYNPRTPLSSARRAPSGSMGTPDGVDHGPESEVDKRQRELYSKQQHLLREQRSADQERLLSCIQEDLGFHHGRPLAALIIFRSCLQWKTFQADRTQLFDRIINAMGSQIEQKQENNTCLSYWLSNTVTLLFLLQKNIKPASGGSYNARLRSPAARGFFGGKAGGFTSFFSRTAGSPNSSGAGLEASIHSGGMGGFRQVEAKYPALLFKQQLDAFVQKIFPMLRDNVKKEITPQLAACIHAPRAASTRSRRTHSITSHSDAATAPPGMAATAQLSAHWSNILAVFEGLLTTLKRSNVPAFLVRKLFQQLFSFVNVQLFNQLLLRRECCSFSNGEYVKTGLGEVEQWIHAAGSHWVGESWEQLKYIRQAVSFLVIHQKHNKSLEEITTDLCPVLSVQQLYRISTMYWDDRYGTETVSHDVLSRMKQLMVENNSAASHSFLLDDDSSIPFSLDDIQSLMDDKEMYSDVPVPKALRESKNFEFLKRDLRRAGSLTEIS